MKKLIVIYPLVIIFAVMACAPKTVPSAGATPAPAAAPVQTSQVPALTSNLPPPTSQDASWAKVIEAAKKEGEVTIYAYAFTGDAGIALSKAFKDKYGIKLNIVTGRGAEQTERVKTEQRIKQVVVDYIEGAPTYMNQIKQAGFSASLADIPVLKENDAWVLDPLSTDPDKNLVLIFLAHYPPAINTNLVKPNDEPKSYQDLLNPKWKGKIVENDPNISTSAYMTYTTFTNNKILTNEYFTNLGKQDLQFLRGESEKAEKLSRGEFPVAFMGSESTFPAFAAEGAPLKALAMQEGTLVSGDVQAVIKNGPHPNAAKLFANWIISAEGSQLLAKMKAQKSIRKGISDYRPPNYAVNPIKLIPMTDVDWELSTKLFNEKFLVKFWSK